MRESRDNPGTAGVTLVSCDTLPQGCWGGEVGGRRRRESQDNPRTAGVTLAYWDAYWGTLPQGCWGMRESQGNPGTTSVTLLF